jgi:hypothetical protein
MKKTALKKKLPLAKESLRLLTNLSRVTGGPEISLGVISCGDGTGQSIVSIQMIEAI